MVIECFTRGVAVEVPTLRPFTAFLHLVIAQAYRRRNCASSWWDVFKQRFATTKYLSAKDVYGDEARAALRRASVLS